MNTKRLSVVGFGPGSREQMTIRAVKEIEEAEVIVGFSTYNRILKMIFPDKIYVETGMGKETDRVKRSLELADAGKKTALVCSGDACVYGMAGLAYELSVEYPEVEISVIPGVTAALSGSALLGAACGNDFCVISLSDYHTSKEEIRRRLKSAAECDFVIVLYNTRSRARQDSLRDACDLLLQILPEKRICGVVENIGREGEKAKVLTLDRLKGYEADMFTTVFIGNSRTRVINGKMVTPRGYRIV